MKLTPLPPNTMVENYRIIEVIGYGGFSIVYRAWDTLGKKTVAIKEYYAVNSMCRKENGSLEPTSEKTKKKYRIGLQRFFDEGLTLSKIKHPNIVHVFNFFRLNNTAYLVMGYEKGRDLRWLCKKAKLMPNEEFLLSVFTMICAGVKAIHQKGFLHLDIKPSNLLLRANGIPLILDMGAAYRFPTEKKITVHTLTHGYSSLEQHTKKKLGFYSDIYAISMTMRACITHKSAPSAIKRQQGDNLPLLVDTHGDYYRTEFLEAIDEAAHLEPNKRPQTIDNFIEKLTQK